MLQKLGFALFSVPNRKSYALSLHNGNKEMVESELHILAKNFLDKGNVTDAWKTLLTLNN